MHNSKQLQSTVISVQQVRVVLTLDNSQQKDVLSGTHLESSNLHKDTADVQNMNKKTRAQLVQRRLAA